MGEHDKQLTVYLNDSRRYADMINAGIFGGRQMVLPKDLLPERTGLHSLVSNNIINIKPIKQEMPAKGLAFAGNI